jgi:hypothetical protein
MRNEAYILYVEMTHDEHNEADERLGAAAKGENK